MREWLAAASVVLITDVLEHVADDRAMLASIVNACPPGANILITVPADMRLWSPHDEAFGHYRRYEPKNFRALWSGLPVKPRLLSHFNSRLYPAVRFARAISQRRGRAAGQSNTDFRLPSRPINRVLERIFAGERRKLAAAIDMRNLAVSFRRQSDRDSGAGRVGKTPICRRIADRRIPRERSRGLNVQEYRSALDRRLRHTGRVCDFARLFRPLAFVYNDEHCDGIAALPTAQKNRGFLLAGTRTLWIGCPNPDSHQEAETHSRRKRIGPARNQTLSPFTTGRPPRTI